MKLYNVTVKKAGVVIISGVNGDLDDGVLSIPADNPGLSGGDKVGITADGGFNKPAEFIDEEPSGTLNFKID